MTSDPINDESRLRVRFEKKKEKVVLPAAESRIEPLISRDFNSSSLKSRQSSAKSFSIQYSLGPGISLI